jgi:hypothetical protein
MGWVSRDLRCLHDVHLPELHYKPPLRGKEVRLRPLRRGLAIAFAWKRKRAWVPAGQWVAKPLGVAISPQISVPTAWTRAVHLAPFRAAVYGTEGLRFES